MGIEIILMIIMFAVIGTITYTILGLFPGTDETAVLVPLSTLLLTWNLNPLYVLSFFFAGMIALLVTESIPTSLTGIPGGVMTTPMVGYSNKLKRENEVPKSLSLMTMGSFIGTVIALGLFLIIKVILNLVKVDSSILSNWATKNSFYVFLFGAFFLSLLTKKKLQVLASLVPLGLLFLGVKRIIPNISATPYFLSITTGPFLLTIFMSFFKREKAFEKNEVILPKKERVSIKDSLSKLKYSAYSAVFGSLTFMLSPVGMTVFIGETMVSKINDEKEKAFTAVTIMNALKNSSYLFGILISFFIFKIPVSPAAIGPAGALFNSDYGIVNEIQFGIGITTAIIAIVVALSITVFLSLKYAYKMTSFVFKKISQESIVLMLISLFILLTFLDGGIIAVLVLLVMAIISGVFNKLGVNFGIQFMVYYVMMRWM